MKHKKNLSKGYPTKVATQRNNLTANVFEEVDGGFILTKEQLAKIESAFTAKDATIAALNQKLKGKSSEQDNDSENENDSEDTDPMEMDFQKDILNRID